MDAGRVETFNIGITGATQKKFGLNREAGIQRNIGSYLNLRSDEKELNQGVADFHKTSLLKDISDKRTLRQQLLQSIATSAKAIVTTGELVREDDSIQDKVKQVSGKAVARANSEIKDNRGVRVNLYLTRADRKRLKRFLTMPSGALPPFQSRN